MWRVPPTGLPYNKKGYRPRRLPCTVQRRVLSASPPRRGSVLRAGCSAHQPSHARAWDSTLAQNLAPLGDAPYREHDGSAATRRGRVDRLDVDARLRQPRGDARERSRLVAHAHDERCLLRGAVLGVAQRTLGLTGIFDHDVDLSTSGPSLGTKRRNVDMSVGQRACERREDAGAGPETEGKLGDFGHRYTSSSTVGRRSRP